MTKPLHFHLSRRESQIMDVVYALGKASVADVVERMPDEPGYNTVRNTMTILEKKGYLRHDKEGQKYVYSPAEPVERVKGTVASHLVRTFFGGSLPQAVLAILGSSADRLTREDLDEIARYIEDARQEIE